MQKNQNIEKIAFKVVQMKFLAMHITNQTHVQYTLIYYVNKSFILEAINHLTALVFK